MKERSTLPHGVLLVRFCEERTAIEDLSRRAAGLFVRHGYSETIIFAGSSGPARRTEAVIKQFIQGVVREGCGTINPAPTHQVVKCILEDCENQQHDSIVVLSSLDVLKALGKHYLNILGHGDTSYLEWLNDRGRALFFSKDGLVVRIPNG